MRVLIVEDEKAAARNLAALLAQVAPKIEIIETLDSVFESVEWFESNSQPDVVFMDIHLADGSAFDIFQRVSISCPIIFTTAYDEYAIKAFKVNSIDYLLKPISEQELQAALDKLAQLRSQSQPSEGLENMLQQMIHPGSYATHLLVPRSGDKLIPLAITSVEYFYIESGSVRAVTVDATRYTVPYTLDELCDMVDPSRFCRVNRQFLITRDSIADIDLWFGSRLSLNLKLAPGERIVISKTRVSEFKAWFAGRSVSK